MRVGSHFSHNEMKFLQYETMRFYLAKNRKLINFITIKSKFYFSTSLNKCQKGKQKEMHFRHSISIFSISQVVWSRSLSLGYDCAILLSWRRTVIS